MDSLPAETAARSRIPGAERALGAQKPEPKSASVLRLAGAYHHGIPACREAVIEPSTPLATAPIRAVKYQALH